MAGTGIDTSIVNILRYYPIDSSTITKKFSGVLGLHPQTVALANGSTELITWIDHLMIKQSVAIPIPTFGRWTDQPLETGDRVDMVPLQERDGFRVDLEEDVRFIRDHGSRVAVVCNVNKPGRRLPAPARRHQVHGSARRPRPRPRPCRRRRELHRFLRRRAVPVGRHGSQFRIRPPAREVAYAEPAVPDNLAPYASRRRTGYVARRAAR